MAPQLNVSMSLASPDVQAAGDAEPYCGAKATEQHEGNLSEASSDTASEQVTLSRTSSSGAPGCLLKSPEMTSVALMVSQRAVAVGTCRLAASQVCKRQSAALFQGATTGAELRSIAQTRLCVMQSAYDSKYPLTLEPLNLPEQRLKGTLAEVWRVQLLWHGSAEAAVAANDLAKLDAKLSELHAAGKAAKLKHAQDIVDVVITAGKDFLGEGKFLLEQNAHIPLFTAPDNACSCAVVRTASYSGQHATARTHRPLSLVQMCRNVLLPVS